MPTALWTCGTLERVTLSRGKAGVPLLSLKMSVLRLFLPVCRQKHTVEVRAYKATCMFLYGISCQQPCGRVEPKNVSHFRVAKQGYHFLVWKQAFWSCFCLFFGKKHPVDVGTYRETCIFLGGNPPSTPPLSGVSWCANAPFPLSHFVKQRDDRLLALETSNLIKSNDSETRW